MATFAKPENTLILDEEAKSDKGSLPSKRKPDLTSLDKDNMQEETDDSNKKQRLGISSTDNNNPLISEVEENKDVNGISSADNNNPLISEVEENKDLNGTENISIEGDKNKDVEEDEDDEDDYEAEEEDEDDDEEDDTDDNDDGQSSGYTEIVDRKGKGIMRADKGKGKLIEESEDSSDSGSESDGDSDLSDDPLAEVDLDNILPSRTRRRVVRPGISISNNQGSKEPDNDDSDDNDS